MDECISLFLRKAQGIGAGLVVYIPAQHDLCAQRLGPVHLDQRRGGRHDDDRLGAETLGRIGYALGVISGGSRDQSLLPLLIAEGADLVVGAPHLVGAGPLAVLGFQVDLSSGELAEVIGIDQRSVEGDLVHRLARLFKSGQRQFLSILHNVSPVLSFQNINRISHLQTGRG